MSLTIDDVFYLYERNKTIYNNCKLLNKECITYYDNICYCFLDENVFPITIGEQTINCMLNRKCYIKIGEECPICLEKIIYKTNAYLTGCGHAYHRLCLFKVFETQWKQKPYSTFKCCICRCYLGCPDLFERYNKNGNELDQLENFWLSKDYIMGIFCGRNKHYLGMNNKCKKCLIYRITGEY